MCARMLGRVHASCAPEAPAAADEAAAPLPPPAAHRPHRPPVPRRTQQPAVAAPCTRARRRRLLCLALGLAALIAARICRRHALVQRSGGVGEDGCAQQVGGEKAGGGDGWLRLQDGAWSSRLRRYEASEAEGVTIMIS